MRGRGLAKRIARRHPMPSRERNDLITVTEKEWIGGNEYGIGSPLDEIHER